MTIAERIRARASRGSRQVADGRQPWSLKAIVAVTFALLLTLAIGIIVAVNERILSRGARTYVQHDLDELVAQMRYRLDRSMFERYRDIQVASSLDPLRSESVEASRRVLESLQATYRDYAWIGFADVDGRVLASTGRVLEGEDVSGRDWFRRGLDGPFVGDVHPAHLLAERLAGPGQRELRLVDVAAPVFASDGRLIGVLGAHLNWSWAEEVAASILATRDPEERIEVFIRSSSGDLLLATHHDAQGAEDGGGDASGGPNDIGRDAGTWTDVGRYFVRVSRSIGYRDYEGLGWQVVVRQPKEVALAHVERLRRDLLIIGAGLTLCFTGIGWVLAGWIGQPLRAIAQAAVLARAGGSDASIPASRRFAEVRSLSESLRAFVADLQLKQSELRLSADENERRQRFLSAILSNMDDAVFVNKGGRIVFANAACARLFGVRDAAALHGCSPLQFFHQDDLQQIATRIAALQTPETRVPTAEERIVRLDGSVLIAEVTAASFIDDTGPAILVILRDITARKATERQLQHAQRLDAVGQLTGGMAHDFNNLLTVVIGNLDLLEAQPELKAEERELAAMALEAALRGAELTHQLLAFSRRQSLEAKAFDLNKLVGTTQRLLRRTLGERVQVRSLLGDDLWLAFADPAQVESALTNLAINARDAMLEGGILTIETANRHLDADYASENAEVEPGDYVMLSVSDTGTGMPADVVAKACEPFFTTKADGKGSGLGLAMIYGFAKQSNGHVKIYSEVGHGTTVRLYLPRADRPSEAAVAEPEDVASGSDSTTILVVDDDAAVRRVAVRQITELGYAVIEAEDASAALEMIRQGLDVDLLFTDFVMPGALMGPELARQARELRPGLKVLFTSGFAEAPTENGSLTSGMRKHDLLSKPYRKQELARRLAQILRGSDDAT